MTPEYDAGWVAVSLAMAVLASYTALGLANRVAAAPRPTAAYWVAGSGLAMGTGIWSMHFIGMLAFHLPNTGVGYGVGITLVSALLGVIASGFAFWIHQRRIDNAPFGNAAAALLMGGGIAAMHYTGMAAMAMEPPIRYKPGLFTLSIAIAIGASWAALALFNRLRDENLRHYQRWKIVSATLMGIAIGGMHYTGMAAAAFAPGSASQAAGGMIGSDLLAMLTGVGGAIVLLLSLAMVTMDRQRGSNAFYLALLDTLAVLGESIVVVEKQRVVYINDAACALFACSSEEARTIPAADLLRRIDWSDTEAVLEQMRRGEWREGEHLLCGGGCDRPDAKAIRLVVRFFRHGEKQRVLLTLADVSAQQRLANQQKDRERFLRTVLYEQCVAAFVIDAEHRVISWNRACEELTGIKENEVLGKPDAWRGFYRDEHPCAADRILAGRRSGLPPAAAPGGGRLRVEHWFENIKGQRRYLIIDAAPIIDNQGRAVAVIETLLDVTHLKQVEEALEETTREAEGANQAKSQFLANMSHEIRTPLNGVLGMAQLLLAETLPDAERLEYARTILASGEALLTILNDILDLSKIEAGRLEITPIAMTPARVVREVAALFGETIRQKDLALHMEIDPALEQAFHCDPVRLRQILSNLLGNAVKFTHEGYIRLHASLSPEQDAAERILRFEIHDSGVGIDEKDQQHLFQRFVQADATPTRRQGGTGLGLAICRELCHLMGGEIGVSSQMGQGSAFWFTVRARPAHGEAQDSPALAACSPSANFDPAEYRILLVEDNEINRKLAHTILTQAGYRVDCAGDGQEALAAVDNAHYDAILMDCHMPVLDGWEATRAIRARERDLGLVPIPIIALTAAAFGEDRASCLEAGMDGYLSKPFSRKALSENLRRHLAQAAPTAGDDAASLPAANAAQAGGALFQRLSSLPGMAGAARALALVDGDEDIYLEIIHLFVADQADTGEAIRQAWAANRSNDLRRHLHVLRGLAGTIGADELVTRIRAAENELAQPATSARIAALLDAVIVEHDALLAGLIAETSRGDEICAL